MTILLKILQKSGGLPKQKLNNRPRKTLEFDSPIQDLIKNKISFQS